VVLGPCLCRLGASAAVPGLLDQGSLLQKETKLADGPKLADDAHGSLSAPAFLKQIPGMEGMMEGSNITMQDIMGVAQQVLMSLMDEEFVDLVNSSLRSALVVADKYVVADSERQANLKADGANLTSAEEAYELLTTFFKVEEKAALELADVLSDKLKAVAEGAPKNLTEAFDKLAEKMGAVKDEKGFDEKGFDKMADMLKEKLSGLFKGVTTCTNVTLCQELKPALANLTLADNMINGQVLPMLTQLKPMLPSIGPMVAMMVPEVADTVTDLANSTIEKIEPIMIGFGEIFHGEVQTVTKISTVHSHCSFGSGSVRSGPGLLLLAVALAAWSSLRA